MSDILLGNDVVDLKDPDSCDVLQNDRFIRRVFSPAEIELIKADSNPLLRLWSCWAVKEACYKALVAVYPGTLFAWQEYQVDLESGTVEHRMHHLAFRVEQCSPEMVHVVCCGSRDRSESGQNEFPEVARPAHRHLDAIVSRISPGEGLPEPIAADRQSEELRSWTLQNVAQILKLDHTNLEIISTGAQMRGSGDRPVTEGARFSGQMIRVPRILYEGRPVDRPLSNSHHGRFMALALYNPVERPSD